MPEKVQDDSQEKAIKAAYEQGFKAALDHRRSYVTFAEEAAVPLEWEDYTDEQEREAISAIVQFAEYQDHFKENLKRQAMLKWRQARLASHDPEKVRLLFGFGNMLMDLVEFYEHAGDAAEPSEDPSNHGYDSSLTEL